MSEQKTYLDSHARLKAIIDSAIDGIIMIDEKGIVESLNPAAAKMFGYNSEEVVGKNINMLMPEPHQSNHDQYLKNYRDTGKKRIIGIGREVLGKRKDGSTFPFRLSVAEVILGNKKRIFTGIIHDTSDRALAKTIQLALEKEQKLNELKSRFVSIASHEFRTPLTSILSSATLISKYKDEASDHKRMKHVQRICSSVRNLTNILNDFLSLSKLEEGKTVHQPLHFNLKNLALELTEEMQAIAKIKQRIEYQHFGDIEQVFLDKKMLHNILINLLSNAIKYSEEGQQIHFASIITKDKIEIGSQT